MKTFTAVWNFDQRWFAARGIALAALLIELGCGLSLHAANASPDPSGHWEGAITLPSAALAIQVDLLHANDAWQGTIDIPAQGTHDFALNPVAVNGNLVVFAMPGVAGGPAFSGRLSDDAKTINGDFTQGGQKFPFKLDRAAKPVVVPLTGLPGMGVAGRWQGTLRPAPGIELRLALEISRAGLGESSGVLISIDQGNVRIPVTALAEHEGVVHFETPSVMGAFDGRLNDNGSEIAGNWKQSGGTMPLVFKRLALATSTDETRKAKGPEPSGEPNSATHFKWLILSPIPVAPSGGAAQPDEAAQKKAFSSDLLAAQGGEAQVEPKDGDKLTLSGTELTWKPIDSSGETISLNFAGKKDDFEIAYASTEFDVPSAAQTWLGIGSDDAVRVWLNGKLVHENWCARVVQVDEDVVSVPLKAGKNHLLLKVQNITGSWGFACRLMDSGAIAERLISVSGTGDLDALKVLLDKGFDINARDSTGLTALLAARLHGQSEIADFLVNRGANASESLPDTGALVDRLFEKRVGMTGAGAAVLVARNGKILFEKGYGLADIEGQIPVTPATKFRIGSITKQFTAAAILKLQEADKVHVTDLLSAYYPEFPRGNEVTLGQMMTHTSGIHSYTSEPGFLDKVTTATTSAQLIASIEKHPFDFDPGARWSYSNSNFLILGAIVEKASGQKYEDYLRQALFEPLGMASTGVYHNDKPPSGAAVGYEYENDRFKRALDWNMTWAGGAGSLYSTVEDLYRWNEGIFGHKVLSEKSLSAAFSPVATRENKDDNHESGYGYGWLIEAFRNFHIIWHNGGLNGFLSSLLRIPDKNLTVVVLVNAEPPKPNAVPDALAHEIAEFYVGSELGPRPSRSSVTVSHEALSAVVGRYDYNGAILIVTQEGDRLFAQLGFQPRFELFPRSETEFFWKVVDAQVTFVKDPSGKVVGATHHQNGVTFHAPRLADVVETKLDDTHTDPLLGGYDAGSYGKMTISRDGGRLYSQLSNQPRVEMGATSDTEFFLRQVNAQLTLVKDANGRVKSLILHQGGQEYEWPKLK